MDIHQDEFGRQLRDMAKSLVCIGCTANEIEVVRFRQDLHEDFQHERRIVRYHPPDSGVGRSLCWIE